MTRGLGRWRLCYVLPLLAALLVPAKAEVRNAGNVSGLVLGLTHVEANTEDGAILRVDVLSSQIVRVRFRADGDRPSLPTGAVVRTDWKPLPVTSFNLEDAAYLITDDIQVIVHKKPLRLDILRGDGTPILVDDEIAFTYDTTSGLALTRKRIRSGERYLGIGVRGGPMDRRGRRFTLSNADRAAYGEFTDPLYISIPFFYGVQDGAAYGVYLDSAVQPFFEFGPPPDPPRRPLRARPVSRPDNILFGVNGGRLDYYLFVGPELETIAREYSELTGKMPLPPRWTLGYHMSRYGYESAQEVLDIARRFREDKIPADVIWLDIDYMDQFQAFSWNPENFPDPTGFTQALHDSDFELVNIFEPCIREDDPLWAEADSAGLFLKNEDGQTLVNEIWFGMVSWLDFTESAARTWYENHLSQFLGSGISGTWIDLNEPAQNFMPEARYSFDGKPRTDFEARNLYALHMAATAFEAQKAARPNHRPWVFSRSGFSGIQRYSSNWSGDAEATWDSLRVQIQMTASVGILGQPFFGHDIGGFLGNPSPELFLRWMQFSLYTPLFRNHSDKASDRREPWQFPEPFRRLIGETIEQRYRLLPYIYTLMEDASRSGVPAVAPGPYFYPGDGEAFKMDTEFFLGRDLLVAPVFAAGVSTRKVYLPAGESWFELATGRSREGGSTVDVNVELDHIPVFVREGAVIPGSAPVQSSRASPEWMTVDAYPGPDRTFVLYEDDGVSLDYQSGNFLRTELVRTQDPETDGLRIRRLDGKWNPPKRDWIVRFHGVPKEPSAVTLNGNELERVEAQTPPASGWSYSASERRLQVKFADGPDGASVRYQ